MKALIKKILPGNIYKKISLMRQRFKRSYITHPHGSLDPFQGNMTFVMVVGSTFDQRKTNAMMMCRMGYCHAFEKMSIPYIIIDIRDVPRIIPELPNPFCMIYGMDLIGVSKHILKILQSCPCGVWVQPWFKGSKAFYDSHNMDSRIWTYSKEIEENILQLNARFGFTATVNSGMHYFELWEKHGLKMKSLPLACDTTIYNLSEKDNSHYFNNVKLAFVGGYWTSKGRQIDRYLRPWEDELTIYGYNEWPYTGYKGQLPINMEASLYKNAKVCPVINEPTVALMRGQINERVFKVLGSGGCPIVDAVPCYNELYNDNELLISKDDNNFHECIKMLLSDKELNERYRKVGAAATLERHTYVHRAKDYMQACGI